MSFFEEFGSLTKGFYEYHKNKKKLEPIRLCMAMQVKDEVDIIEQNIKYHAAKGCEAFFIVDNNSTDGTREVLEDLKTEYNLHLFSDKRNDHGQSKNMTMLTHTAQKQGFDWVIENDADEFWYPFSGSLKSGLDRNKTVLRVKRVNLMPFEGDEAPWFNYSWHTKNTLHFNLDSDISDKVNNFLFAPVLHKVMVNAHGITSIGGGNHGARHIIDKLHGRKYSGWNENIKIFHYALREYSQFKKKVENINKSLKYTSSQNYKKHNFGPQAIYWNQAYEAGRLEEVYENMVLKAACVECYQHLGLVEEDSSLKKDLITVGLVK